MASDIDFASFRSLDDFLLGSARFQVPPLNEPARWNNRVLNNLMYYQSNYMVVTFVVFCLVGIYRPVDMLLGFCLVAIFISALAYLGKVQSSFQTLRSGHPYVTVIIVMLLAYLVMQMFGAVITFMFGLALPLLLILVHSSLRLRNLKSKVSNKTEMIGLKKTPMGILLGALGMELDIF